MYISYYDWVYQKYSKNPYKHKMHFQTYLDRYKKTNGFSDWLESLKGIQLTENQAQDIAKTYNRSEKDTPAIFACLSRQYNIELPLVEGILTAEYWQKLGEI